MKRFLIIPFIPFMVALWAIGRIIFPSDPPFRLGEIADILVGRKLTARRRGGDRHEDIC